ncbi:MAG: hypothetical protein JXA91_01925 [Candidatus Thermoplasmatota archaeon]|nr:hypothetical protein [Candidatus Thermoplasmatota archaeon]
MQKKCERILSKKIYLVALCIWFIMPSAIAETWIKVKVTTVTGWQYQNVTVETVPDKPYIVIINPDGATKQISRANIALILDENGKDITAIVFEDTAGTGTTTGDTENISQSDDPSSPNMSFRKSSDNTPITPWHSRDLIYGPRYKVALLAGVGHSMTTGEWFEGLTSGQSFNVCGRMNLVDNIYIGLGYRYQTLGIDSDMENSFFIYDEYGYPSSSVDVDFNVHLNETYFLIGFITESSTYKSPFGFIEVGLGAIDHNFEVTLSQGTEVVSASSDESKFGLLMSLGGVLPFNETFGLCFDGNIRLTGQGDSDTYDDYYEGSSGALYGFGISLIIMLGK